jgi:hypothetical protein
VVRTSNAYSFADPASKSEKKHPAKDLITLCAEAAGLSQRVGELYSSARASSAATGFRQTIERPLYAARRAQARDSKASIERTLNVWLPLERQWQQPSALLLWR